MLQRDKRIRDFVVNKLAIQKQIKNERDFLDKHGELNLKDKTAKLTKFYSSQNSNKV
jgi:hypothetical protein